MAKAPERFGFDRFRDLALDPSLSINQKMDGVDASRDGYDDAIWAAIRQALPRLGSPGADVLDIGPGCGGVAHSLIALAEAQGHRLTLVDHAEMMALLPPSPAVTRVAGRFPEGLAASPQADQAYDVILAYSVLQYVIVDANPFAFIDAALARLKPGGALLVGDMPNFSKLRRFLSSEAGVAHHHAYMHTDQPPDVPAFPLLKDRIDDGVVLGLVTRARLAGFDAYLLPQSEALPFARWREDLLIQRP
ncbi:class I SAM-dependent methyltransferase [Phenylobacterium sp.]|uniref:class I SAM-dependent methyltransferase n=1 Tax=Phenylobacterium sp. TaxID=1871053 RepID=UPI002F40B7A4